MKKHLIVVCFLAAFMVTLVITSAHAQTPDSLAVPAQAFTRRQPSSPPLPASHRFVTQEAITRTFVKRASVCPTHIKVYDSDVMQEMKDAAQRQLHHNVRSKASCINIGTEVYTYVQKGGRL